MPTKLQLIQRLERLRSEFSQRRLTDSELKALVKADSPKVEKVRVSLPSRHTNPGGLMRHAGNEFGEWLSLPPWNWYTTHTFKAEYVSPRQSDKAWYSWFNSVRVAAKATGLTPTIHGPAAPFYFRVAEYQDRGTLHYHSLIGNVGDIRRLLFKDLWELHGYARVEKYEVGKGANYYVGKYLTKVENGDIRFSHNLTQYLQSNAIKGVYHG